MLDREKFIFTFSFILNLQNTDISDNEIGVCEVAHKVINLGEH